MKKLIPMVDFVLEQYKSWDGYLLSEKCVKYAKFLKQPLKLEIFVPCDSDGNVLELPIIYDGMDSDALQDEQTYFKAKEKVLFECFELIKNKNHYIVNFCGEDIWYSCDKETIEDLTKYNLTLTESAIKQIGLCHNH